MTTGPHSTGNFFMYLPSGGEGGAGGGKGGGAGGLQSRGSADRRGRRWRASGSGEAATSAALHRWMFWRMKTAAEAAHLGGGLRTRSGG